ncbi:uncharacterized protein [Rutidosis leptorrhynchoides]|uniref:uncharacterized protein n=1 Tax=Rutidosis leptorrhynchoides TaxID=125765 RepID=UPI003A99BCD5
MTAPKTVKEVQSLTGKLAILTRFLSKAAERQLPFFKTLKGCSTQKHFFWTTEAESAFQEMKQLLATLPTLTAPIKGEILYLYVSVANEAFSSVLVAEREKVHKPIYFVSKALTGSEINYAPMKKFVYALLLTSRRSYEITYLPWTSVKVQVLADYLAEMTCELEVIHEQTQLQPVRGETWDLFTDGASCVEGAAEYEALLAGLNIALKLNVTKLCTYIDSQLVSNQFNGSFEAYELSMQKYLKFLKETAEKFEHFELVQVSRNQNKKADALSKLAALTFSHFQKQVWVEELPSKAIDGSLVFAAIEEECPNWMKPIIENMRNNTLPENKEEARLVCIRSPMYTIENGILYRKSYYGPLTRCVGPTEAEAIIEEVHSSSCALHSGYKTIATKNMRMGYFWPTLYRDVAKIVKRCKSCQRRAPQNRRSRYDLNPVYSPWPFYKWAIDIVGPFPAGAGNVKIPNC